jgi:thioredoxin-like negative regulator of GroEL
MNRSTVTLLSLMLALAASACTKEEPAAPGPAEGSASTKPPPPPASADKLEGIAWVKDDLPGALAQAKSTQRPVVVDLWAPWCHTCMSMKKFVLPDARITAMKDDFVWLAVDTDKPVNADVTKTLPLAVWPTFYALDADGGVLARHVGSATVEQMVGFLTRARDAATQGASASPFTVALRSADAKRAAGELKQAATEYEAALAAAGDDPGRFSAAVSLIEALYKAGEYERCAKAGTARLDDMKKAKSASAADFTYFTLTCSKRAERQDHGELLKRAAAADGPIRTLLADKGAALSVDDRSDALRMLRDLEEQLGNKEEARKLATQQRKLLDDEVAKLDDPYAAMTFHWPRAEVYTYLGQGAELVAALEASAKALPKEYEPVYRLAWVLKEIGKHEEAVAPAEAAVRLTYGPRRARALSILADVQKARGDAEAERKARGELVAHLESLPKHQQNDKTLAAAREALAALGAKAAN